MRRAAQQSLTDEQKKEIKRERQKVYRKLAREKEAIKKKEDARNEAVSYLIFVSALARIADMYSQGKTRKVETVKGSTTSRALVSKVASVSWPLKVSLISRRQLGLARSGPTGTPSSTPMSLLSVFSNFARIP